MASLHSLPISNASVNDFMARAAPDLTGDALGTLQAFRSTPKAFLKIRAGVHRRAKAAAGLRLFAHEV
jgi:hypothetical protein